MFPYLKKYNKQINKTNCEEKIIDTMHNKCQNIFQKLRYVNQSLLFSVLNHIPRSGKILERRKQLATEWMQHTFEN